MDLATLKDIGVSDASFASNWGQSSPLGHPVFLSEISTAAIPIACKSYKSKRIARSAMAAEVISYSGLFDISILIGNELDVVLGKRIPVHILTDTQCLFDVISREIRTSEKPTMVDIEEAREAFRD